MSDQPHVSRQPYREFPDLRRPPTKDELEELRRLAREGADRIHQQATTDDRSNP